VLEILSKSWRNIIGDSVRRILPAIHPNGCGTMRI
jgi:hypothetical protein